MILETIVNYLLVNWIEAIGVITTLVSTWLTMKRKVACWPIGLIALLAYLAVFYQARLYASALLQLSGLPLLFYGWWYWERGLREVGEVRVVRLPLPDLFAGLAAGAVGSIALGLWMKHIHAALPYLDSGLTSYSVVGGWWESRKHIANWWLWIVVNVIYVGELIYTNKLPSALLYLILVVLSVLGLREWQRAQLASESVTTDGASAV
jgi:nicotinamide mononucleotide transporter